MNLMEELYDCLPKALVSVLAALPAEETNALEEIRVYVNRPAELMIAGRRRQVKHVVDETGMESLLAELSGQALYRFERQMASGYIPLPGGHRAGVCGTMTRLEDGTWRMSSTTSICIRIARFIEGASQPVRMHLFAQNGRPRRVLLLGAPGCGKTTVLRDAAQYMAGFVHVAVADEREELFAQKDIPLNRGFDVLSGMNKAKAFEMLIRSMAPQVIVCDELGREADVHAVLDAARCGVGILASVHADGLADLRMRPVMQRLFDACAFERYIHLGYHGRPLAIWDETGSRMEGDAGYGELGNGGNGDDRRKQHRISFVGWGKEARSLDSGDAPLSSEACRCDSL